MDGLLDPPGREADADPGDDRSEDAGTERAGERVPAASAITFARRPAMLRAARAPA